MSELVFVNIEPVHVNQTDLPISLQLPHVPSSKTLFHRSCGLIGVMLLGGGFGVMATSSSGFDEDEFDRLGTAGSISAGSQSSF